MPDGTVDFAEPVATVEAPRVTGLAFSQQGQAELFKAYAGAQADMGDVLKNATNPAFRSKYADLATVLGAVMPALTKHGLALIQAPNFDGHVVSVETLIAHSAGGWLRSSISLRPTKNDPQGVGSAITYGRRYAVMSLAGVAPEDDDGNAASGKSNGHGEYITSAQAGEIQEMLESVGANRPQFLKYIGADSIAHIPAAKYETAIGALRKKANETEGGAK